MAYKDEYEVARLYTDGSFERMVAERFEGDYKLQFHLAPPLIGRRDPRTGAPRKRTFGASTMRLFRVLAPLRRLRGTPFDIFGYTAERRHERAAIDDYLRLVESLLPRLAGDQYDTLVELARLPESMRGYGHVKAANVAAATEREALLLKNLENETIREARRA